MWWHLSIVSCVQKNQQAELSAAENLGLDGDFPPVSDLLGNAAEEFQQSETPLFLWTWLSMPSWAIATNQGLLPGPTNSGLQSDKNFSTNGRLLLQQPFIVSCWSTSNMLKKQANGYWSVFGKVSWFKFSLMIWKEVQNNNFTADS